MIPGPLAEARNESHAFPEKCICTLAEATLDV